MTARRHGRVFECVVVDLNTQHDYCDSDGAHPVRNIEELIPALRHMIAWAKRNRTPVISSLESHRAFETQDSSRFVCCLDGTEGQRKIDFTVFRLCVRVEADNTLSCPLDLFKRHQQIIFRKRGDDLLGNPKADRFFTQLPAKEYVLFGVGIEGPIKALALGLLARRKRVSVVIDACGYWNQGVADLSSRQMAAKGAQIITISELLRRKLDRRWRPWGRYTARSISDNGRNGNGRRGNGRPGKRQGGRNCSGQDQ